MNYVQNDYRHTKTAYRALTLSGIALVSAALSTVILPFVLSPIALIFAHLSKGRTKSKHFAARAASVMAILALILNFLIIGFTIYKFNHDEAYRAKIDSLFVQMYGVTMEEYTNQALEAAGISVDENGVVTFVDPSTTTTNNESTNIETTNEDTTNTDSSNTDTNNDDTTDDLIAKDGE